MKKVWIKPTIASYNETELLDKARIQAQTGVIHEDFTDGTHVDFTDG